MTPVVTVAVPSFNQGQFLETALASIFQQPTPVEVFVVDGGSQDDSVEVIKRWSSKLAGWRSHPDRGQAPAINEALAQGTAPYVCWLNSDDYFHPGGLARLVSALEANSATPAAYARASNDSDLLWARRMVWVEPFSRRRLAVRCFISQPATLIRRFAWEAVGGVDESLNLAFDYDLWWRLSDRFGELLFVDAVTAANREHRATKTSTLRHDHYREAIEVVRRHYGRVPFKWRAYWPVAVLLRSLLNRQWPARATNRKG